MLLSTSVAMRLEPLAETATEGGTMRRTITHVYNFANGMTMVFDQYGQQMPDYQGYTEQVMPKIRAAGFASEVPLFHWKAKVEHAD